MYDLWPALFLVSLPKISPEIMYFILFSGDFSPLSWSMNWVLESEQENYLNSDLRRKISQRLAELKINRPSFLTITYVGSQWIQTEEKWHFQSLKAAETRDMLKKSNVEECWIFKIQVCFDSNKVEWTKSDGQSNL